MPLCIFRLTSPVFKESVGKSFAIRVDFPAPALWLSREQWEDEPCEVSESEKKGSFDTDDFFEAALRNSYGDEFYEKISSSG